MSYNLVVMTSFGKTLKERRLEKRLTQDQLHKKSGVSASYISTLEREQPHSTTGALLRPEPDKVEKLAQALDWNISDALELAGYSRKGNAKPFSPKLEEMMKNVSFRLDEGYTEEDKNEVFQELEFAFDVALRRLEERKIKSSQ